MVEMGYNYSGNHTKSGQVLLAPTHPFSTCDRGARTMSHSIPNPSESQNISEEWRPVVGWERLYEVSDHGRVRSLPRFVESKLPSQNGGFWRRGGILKAAPDSHGHLIVVLCDNTYRRTMPVHVLVATAFLGERPEGHDIHHRNTIRTDNRIENLEYLLRGEHNRLHNKGANGNRTKLTREAALFVRRLALEGKFTQPQIAKMFGISPGNVSCIKLGRSWKD